MFARFSERSNDLEHLDIGDYTPEEYEGCIVELQRVNQWLGDARALRLSLLADIEQADLRQFLRARRGGWIGRALARGGCVDQKKQTQWQFHRAGTKRAVSESSSREVERASRDRLPSAAMRSDFLSPTARLIIQSVRCSPITWTTVKLCRRCGRWTASPAVGFS